MIYCVVPEELAEELYDRLVAYYEDDPNVTVIVDRRKASRRSPGSTGGGLRERRDRRRSRVRGEFQPIDVAEWRGAGRRPRGRRRPRHPGTGGRRRGGVHARRRR